jgi:hypothetical protein
MAIVCPTANAARMIGRARSHAQQWQEIMSGPQEGPPLTGSVPHRPRRPPRDAAELGLRRVPITSRRYPDEQRRLRLPSSHPKRVLPRRSGSTRPPPPSRTPPIPEICEPLLPVACCACRDLHGWERLRRAHEALGGPGNTRRRRGRDRVDSGPWRGERREEPGASVVELVPREARFGGKAPGCSVPPAPYRVARPRGSNEPFWSATV